jgi:hypothetical protein
LVGSRREDPFNRGKCQTAVASPAEPGELPIGLEILRRYVEILRPTLEFLRGDGQIVRPTLEILRSDVEILRPSLEFQRR